jgi:hypothetical protein
MTPTTITDLDLMRPRHVMITSATDVAGVVASRFRSNSETSVAGKAIPSESSTDRSEPPQSLERDLERLFAESRYDVFEDGMNSEFGRRLVAMVRTYGNSVLLEINALLRSAVTSKSVAAECLRVLGLIKDRSTHAFRRWILADFLNAKRILVRDAAIVGLSSLDDPAVLPSLRLALQNESSAELRSDLDQLREQLENPERRYALSSAENP